MNNKLVGICRLKIRARDKELNIYRDILSYNNIDYVSLDPGAPDFWTKIKSVDYFIFKWGMDHHNTQVANSILPVIEDDMKKKCFPNRSTCWHYDDKIKQYLLLQQGGFPVVESFIFWDKDSAMNWLENYLDFPIVFKLKSGAGSLSVFLIKSKHDGKKMINRMFGRGMLQSSVKVSHLLKTLNYDWKKIYRYYGINFRNSYFTTERQYYWLKHKNYVYFQRFLPNNHWDTRVTTAGLRAHAFRRFNRSQDFRASGSNDWDIDPANIDLRMIKIAIEISKCYGFQSMAYDFIYDENGDPRIIEISYLYGGAGYPDFMNGYWDENLVWHPGRYWPQFFELVDLLEKPQLVCPDKLDVETDYKNAIGI